MWYFCLFQVCSPVASNEGPQLFPTKPSRYLGWYQLLGLVVKLMCNCIYTEFVGGRIKLFETPITANETCSDPLGVVLALIVIRLGLFLIWCRTLALYLALGLFLFWCRKMTLIPLHLQLTNAQVKDVGTTS